MMLIIGAALAGVFLILKELIPLLGALSTGVIYSKGHRRTKVERAVEPERFRNLCRNRYRGIGLGLIALALAIGLLVRPYVVALMTSLPSPV